MLDTKYNYLEVEKGKYDNWNKAGYFSSGDLSKKPYCVVIPPPNVTGKLHLGHAWNTTIQDIMVRFKRMDGVVLVQIVLLVMLLTIIIVLLTLRDLM